MSNRTRHLVLLITILWIGFGLTTGTHAGIVINTPAGLAPGDQFRIAFVTDGTTDATSTNIADYNAFVTAQAGGAIYDGSTVNWFAIGSTSSVSAFSNTQSSTSDPVYLNSGTQIADSLTTASGGLWSTQIGTGNLLHAIDKDLTSTASIGIEVWTGTLPDGSSSSSNPLGGERPISGFSGNSNFAWVLAPVAPPMPPNTTKFALYGISEELTVPSPTAVPEPSTLVMSLTAAAVMMAASRCRALFWSSGH
jgi:hypothetical protein